MAGGIAIAAGVTAGELFAMSAIRSISDTDTNTLLSNFRLGAWRPPQWGSSSDAASAMYCVTVPGAYATVVGAANSGQGITGQDTDADGTLTLHTSVTANQVTSPQPATYLVFDGVMRAQHSQIARPTQFPVQAQANITDHVVLEPAHLGLDIIMSDAQQSFATGQWVGNPSKSVSCFMVLDALRAARVPLTVSTRLKTYENMVLVDVVPEENARTRYGLRARVEFQQIIVATVETAQANSARSQTTGQTLMGPTNTTSVPAGVTSQNGVDASAVQVSNGVSVPNAGNWSSNGLAGGGS